MYQVNSLFQAWRLRSCLPPSPIACWKIGRPIIGTWESSLTNCCIRFVRACSISVGMPCMRVKYWVRLLTTMFAMSHLPSYVGQLLLHCQSDTSTLSRVGDHRPSCPTSFPIYAPSALTGSLSWAMWTEGGIG